MSFHPINSRTRNSCGLHPQRFVLAFGAYGRTVCLVWADHLEDALDECIDWAKDNAPGLFCDDSVNEEYNRAIAEGKSEDEAYEKSTVDTICAGKRHCRYMLAGDVHLVCENPDRQTLKEIVANATR